MKNPQETIGENTFISFHLENGHNSFPICSIWMIFVANMVISYVLMCPMMTRTPEKSVEGAKIGLKEDQPPRQYRRPILQRSSALGDP